MKPQEEAVLKQMALNRRARALAYAFLQRGHKAGIPDQFLRINQEKFRKLLCTSYHKNVDAIADFVYKHPEDLMEIPFILIDGGDHRARNMAGFAILFRLITCDKIGMFHSFRQLVHQFSTWETMSVKRNDLASNLKQYDALFIGEASPEKISAHTETPVFFDEVFHERLNNIRPTIISYSKQMGEVIYDDKCSQSFADFSVHYKSGNYMDRANKVKEGSDENPCGNYFRVRVQALTNLEEETDMGDLGIEVENSEKIRRGVK